MIRSHSLTSSVLTSAICLLGACSSGGGGGTAQVAPLGPQIPANIPAGTGVVSIQMAGTWEVRSGVVIDTNSPTPAPPPDGAVFVLESTRVQSIGGLSVAPGFLEVILGSPLTFYVNLLDGRTLLYGVTVDNRASGGTREQVGLAGGTIDDNTISIEAYTSTQTATAADPVFTLVRYLLVRTSGAVPAAFEFDDEPSLADDECEVLRQRFWHQFGVR